MKEIWKPIEKYEGYYEISNFGRVKSVDRYVKQGEKTIHYEEKIKKIYINKSGYPHVTLCKNGKSRSYLVHILIAKAFIPNPYNKPCVDHINTDTKDFRIENLRWVTHKENSNNIITIKHLKNDASNKEQIKKRLIARKQNNTKTGPITVCQYTRHGEFIKEYFSAADAARENGLNNSAIARVVDNSSKLVGGYLWTSCKKDNIKYTGNLYEYNKPVCQLDKQGNIIKEWPSLIELSKESKIELYNLRRHIKHKKYTSYWFMYKEDIK